MSSLERFFNQFVGYVRATSALLDMLTSDQLKIKQRLRDLERRVDELEAANEDY